MSDKSPIADGHGSRSTEELKQKVRGAILGRWASSREVVEPRLSADHTADRLSVLSPSPAQRVWRCSFILRR